MNRFWQLRMPGHGCFYSVRGLPPGLAPGVGLILLAGVVLGPGCQTREHEPRVVLRTVVLNPPAHVVPQLYVAGRVLGVDTNARSAAVVFPPGCVPGPGQELTVLRSNQPVARLRVLPRVIEDTVLTEVLEGTCAPGDAVEPLR